MLSLNSMLSFKSSESPLRISPVKKPIVTSHFSPWLVSLAYPLGRYLVMPFYFDRIDVAGQENLPQEGPIILAPTHRSRWDALIVPYAAGRQGSGRDLRFMVSADEVKGLQGWFIRRLGGFPVDTRHPTIASLRHGVEVLQAREALVIFPEGGIFRDPHVHPLKPGFARLALQAEASQPNLGIKIVPISLQYSAPFVPWRCRIRVNIGKPLNVADYHLKTPKQSAQKLTTDVENALIALTSQV